MLLTSIATARKALCDHLFAGYTTVRPLDLTDLDLFTELRILAPVCWIEVQLSQELDAKGRAWLTHLLSWLEKQ